MGKTENNVNVLGVGKIAEKIWALTNEFCDQAKNDNAFIRFASENHDAYKERFIELNDMILHKYMKNEVKDLDRHKIAGIAIASLLESDIIQYTGELGENKFFGKYTIAASVAISYMQDNLNNMLQTINRDPVTKIEFPQAFSCDTDCFEVFCRNIQFADENESWNINPLDISEKLFMYEYLTLLENTIPIELIRDTTKKNNQEGHIDENVKATGTTI